MDRDTPTAQSGPISSGRDRTSAPAAVSAVLELEVPWSNAFDDPRQEWRRLFSELFGTFLLVLVGAGGSVVDAVSTGQIGRAAGVTAPGLMVLAMILFMGGIGGRT